VILFWGPLIPGPGLYLALPDYFKIFFWLCGRLYGLRSRKSQPLQNDDLKGIGLLPKDLAKTFSIFSRDEESVLRLVGLKVCSTKRRPQGTLLLLPSLTSHHLLGLIGLHVAIVLCDLLWGS
jgi:hypothetical protein